MQSILFPFLWFSQKRPTCLRLCHADMHAALSQHRPQEQGLDTVDANRALGLPDDCREYTSVRNMLQDMGVKSIRLIVSGARDGRGGGGEWPAGGTASRVGRSGGASGRWGGWWGGAIGEYAGLRSD